ncbi:hypothetical protein BD289DRAFT_139780 [Coniella lustricola]|uniref:Uncharacterized protein n=1 Tax=Coniella lustricola TaxID=2025994 RepID=A0A2T3AF41_9PEZI|nr:hypothetical protein BD289DRAFT_139780 [Coniella lustricola]
MCLAMAKCYQKVGNFAGSLNASYADPGLSLGRASHSSIVFFLPSDTQSSCLLYLRVGVIYRTASICLLLSPHPPSPPSYTGSPDLSAGSFFCLLDTKLLADAVRLSVSAISGRVDPGGNLPKYQCRLLPALDTVRSPVRKVGIDTIARLETKLLAWFLGVVKGNRRLSTNPSDWPLVNQSQP